MFWGLSWSSAITHWEDDLSNHCSLALAQAVHLPNHLCAFVYNNLCFFLCNISLVPSGLGPWRPPPCCKAHMKFLLWLLDLSLLFSDLEFAYALISTRCAGDLPRQT